MNNSDLLPVITGIGITSAIGQTKEVFLKALLEGKASFYPMERKGRQKESAFIGAEIASLNFPTRLPSSLFVNATLSSKVAALTLCEAWEEAGLDDVAPEKVGLIIGGSNIQQRELLLLSEPYMDKPYYLRPHYGLSFLDSDITGLCSELFGIRGQSYTVGGASASGQLALIQAVQKILQGELDVCIAIGALMDLSYLELYALQAMGAMGVGSNKPFASLNRPFDRAHEGFIYGENCAAIVVESKAHALSRGALSLAQIVGWAIQMDAHRDPDPGLYSEIDVIKKALAMAGFRAQDIDYVNPHGTGAPLGDSVELEALHACGLNNAFINTTKSITGHGLTSAGAVEIVATLLQMKAKALHPSCNLDNPIRDDFNWVRNRAIPHVIEKALSLSFGFGGINTAVCLQKSD